MYIRGQENTSVRREEVFLMQSGTGKVQWRLTLAGNPISPSHMVSLDRAGGPVVISMQYAY